jgi:hypothetical protein
VKDKTEHLIWNKLEWIGCLIYIAFSSLGARVS